MVPETWVPTRMVLTALAVPEAVTVDRMSRMAAGAVLYFGAWAFWV